MSLKRLQTCMASSLWQKLLSCNYPRLDPFKPTDLVPLLDKLTTTATTIPTIPYYWWGSLLQVAVGWAS